MKSKIKCPNCGQEYIVDDSFIGWTAECKICGMTFSTRRKSQNTKTIIITILLIAGSLFFIVVLLGFGAAGTVKRAYMKGLEAKKEHRDDEALKYFRIAAEKGHAEAQFELGQYYEKENEEENEEAFLTNMEAARWYLKAAVQGHTEAQYRLGKHYLNGVEAGREEAARWFLLAAADGHKDAQYELGRCFLDGKGIPKDLDAAEKSFETAAKQGNTDAGKYLDIIKTIKSANQGNVQDQYKLGELYIAGDIVKEDKNEAFKWFRKAAERGYKDAQYQLGVCFYRGDGVGKNVSETMKWWKKAAEQGHGKAQSNIGVLFYNGNGVEKDLSEAVKWFRMAAEQGNREAQKNLGHCFYVGDGVEKDLSEAVKWFLKAAEQGEEYASAFLDSMNADYNLINKAVQGDTDAQFQLAETLRKNLKWDKSIEDTRLNDMMFTWYEKAAYQGNWKAQYNLGVCYYKRYDQIFIMPCPLGTGLF